MSDYSPSGVTGTSLMEPAPSEAVQSGSLRVFSWMDNTIDGFLNAFTEQVQSNLNSGIATILVTSVALYLVFYGYLVLAGKLETPVPDLIWNLAKFMLIIMFIQNAGGLLTMAQEAIKGLTTLGMGEDGQSGLSFLDSHSDKVTELAEVVAKEAPTGTAWVVRILVWLGFLLGVAPSAILLLKNKFAMYFLLAFAPLFLFTMMWGWTKQFFANYLSKLFSCVLTIIAVTTLLSAIADKLLAFMAYEAGNPFQAAFMFVVAGFFSNFIIVYCAEMLAGIAQVSIEHTMPGRANFAAQALGFGGRYAGARIGTAAMNYGKKWLAK